MRSASIFDKFEPEHVSQFLNQSQELEQEERRLERSNRSFRLVYALMGLSVFVFMTLFLLPEHAGLYIDMLKALGIFAAGAAGGYGLKAYRDSFRATRSGRHAGVDWRSAFPDRDTLGCGRTTP